MNRSIFILVIGVILLSCNTEQPKTLIILDQNAYEKPVWQEILEQDSFKLSDVELAFKAYTSTHHLDEETIEHYEKMKLYIESNLDSYGYFQSEVKQYKQLLAFRNRFPKKDTIRDKSKTVAVPFPSNYTFSTPNKDNAGSWKNVGPFGNPDVHWTATGNGALQYVEMHPTNPAIMYVCARNGGLWKTTNYGKNWKPLTDYFTTDNTSTVEVCPANPNILYLGAAEDKKIWYSTDEGISWQDRSVGIDGDIYEIQSDPTDASRAIVATQEGIYLTTNAGQIWEQKIEGYFTEIDVTDDWGLMILSKNRLKNGPPIAPTLYYTLDKGNTFNEVVVKDQLQVHRFYTAIHESQTGLDIVYAYGILDGNSPTRFVGLWKSEFNPNPQNNQYFNFIEVKHPTYPYPNGSVGLREANNAQGFEEDVDGYTSISPYSSAGWISEFFVSPNNPNRLITQNTKMWGTDDGGVLWSLKPSYGESNWADNRYMTTNITKDSIFWCNDGGVWAIKDDDMFPTNAMIQASGLSKSVYINSKVVAKNGDICVIEGGQMDVSKQNKGVFMTGGQDIGQLFTRNGRDTHVASADVYRGRIKPTDDTKFITGSLNVKLNGGSDVYEVYNNIDSDNFNTDRIYGFTRKNLTQDKGEVLLVRSPFGKDGWAVKNFKGENFPSAGGHSWVPISNNWEIVDISSTGISQLKEGTFEQSHVNSELAFLGDEVGQKLFVTENLSSSNPTWVELPNAPKANRYRIATHPYNENFIALATNVGVFVSKDKGETWFKRGNFPENAPKEILIDKNTSEGMYIYTSLTVYYIDELRSEWIEFNKGLPLQNLRDMRIVYYPNGDHRLFVTKYGRGVWSTPLESVLKANGGFPIADFDVFGNTLKEISVGDKIKFQDQSLNADALTWTFKNGSETITINDKITPEVTFNNTGHYKVTLIATNSNGSHTKIKEDYILVLEDPTTPTCNLTADADLVFYKKLSKININSNDIPIDIISSENYYKTERFFQLTENQTNVLEIFDSHVGYNFYIKAWIDYNDDGDFDDPNEEIANSNSKIEAHNTPFAANFTVPSTAILNKLLTLRVVALEANNPPTSCQTTGYRHTIDFEIKINTDVDFTSSHTILSENSASLQTDFTGISSVGQYGFVYSTFNADLNLENSESIISNTTLTGTNFTLLIDNLDYNSIYYYRPFVKDSSGIFYGEIQSFQLVAFRIPQLESYIALNLGNNQWELKGIVYPEGHQLDELFIEYGETDFSNSISLATNNYPTNTKFVISSSITTILNKFYKYRIKAVYKGKIYYSNVKEFDTSQTICTPIVQNPTWYRKISNVTFNGNSNDSSGGSGYQDFSSIVFNAQAGNTHSISVTDSYVGGNGSTYSVYIDFNNDKKFDGNEKVAFGSNIQLDTYTTTITIPTEDVVFNTSLKMRVMVDYNPNAVTEEGACLVESGEVEDYTIKIASVVLGNDEFNLSEIGRIYPNPVGQILHIDLNELNGLDYEFGIYSTSGKILLKNKLESRTNINVSQLSFGIYFIKVSNGYKTYSAKFIKR